MKIFISYKLGEQEEYLLTLLSLMLRKEGFVVSNTSESSSMYNDSLPYETQTAIASSDILIGVVTKNGGNTSLISKEWDFALSNKLSCAFLVEEGIKEEEKYRSKTYYYKRNNLEGARNRIERERDELRRFFELVNYESGKEQRMNLAQSYTSLMVYNVLLIILPVFESKVPV